MVWLAKIVLSKTSSLNMLQFYNFRKKSQEKFKKFFSSPVDFYDKKRDRPERERERIKGDRL
jgi:hypothetical protein